MLFAFNDPLPLRLGAKVEPKETAMQLLAAINAANIAADPAVKWIDPQLAGVESDYRHPAAPKRSGTLFEKMPTSQPKPTRNPGDTIRFRRWTPEEMGDHGKALEDYIIGSTGVPTIPHPRVGVDPAGSSGDASAAALVVKHADGKWVIKESDAIDHAYEAAFGSPPVRVKVPQKGSPSYPELPGAMRERAIANRATVGKEPAVGAVTWHTRNGQRLSDGITWRFIDDDLIVTDEVSRERYLLWPAESIFMRGQWIGNGLPPF